MLSIKDNKTNNNKDKIYIKGSSTSSNKKNNVGHKKHLYM